jgi:hypothetical protein
MLGAREFVGGGETTTFIVGAGEINRLRGRLACHRGALEPEGEKALVTFSITSKSGIFIGIGGGEINNIIINRWRWRWRWRWRLRSRQHHHQKNHGELHARRWHEEPRCGTVSFRLRGRTGKFSFGWALTEVSLGPELKSHPPAPAGPKINSVRVSVVGQLSRHGRAAAHGALQKKGLRRVPWQVRDP